MDRQDSTDLPSRAESSGDNSEARDPQACPNCGSHSVDHYCAVCGQRAGNLHLPVHVFVAKALTGLFALDSRTPQTLTILLRRPGLLTVHYLQGKRARYVAPLRLYLFISFVSFLLLSVAQRGISFEITLPDTDSTGVAVSDPKPDTTGIQHESVDESIESETSGLEGRIADSLRLLADDPYGTTAYVRKRLPWVYFFTMPIFATMVQILYRRRNRFYVPHLVFTLHVYAAGFLLYGLGMAVNLAFDIEWASGIAMLATLCYLFFALRRVYQDNRILTVIKQICLVMAHSLGAFLGIVLLLIYTVLTI